eukprot:CAMPEP_0178373648 /NCGR_PEP_ID=MMETSP0689_2-20121128/1968_1 /TAXON_ID=160604 /ORGANISM="Amphidinium massartii, Strain CS-259" /LENGTH=321 /DNA_ID=CAMNT_0019993591 /DNA_START=124 /DNA_END=1087 /DNA_ORIENTATION=-
METDAALYRHSQIVQGGNGQPEPSLLEPHDETIFLGAFLPMAGYFAGVDPTGPGGGSIVNGRWGIALTLRACYMSWLDGSILVPPTERAPYNYQIVSYDTCPNITTCNQGVAPYATQLTYGSLVDNLTVVPPRLMIGGGFHADILANIAGTRGLPVIDYESELDGMSDKRKYPSYMRTNPLRELAIKAAAAVLIHYNYTKAHALLCNSPAGGQLADVAFATMVESGITLFAYQFTPAELSGWPANSTGDWDGFTAYNYVQEISERKLRERSAAVEDAKVRNAHVWMNYLTDSCADLDVVFEIAYAGFQGPGYLWMGQFINF